MTNPYVFADDWSDKQLKQYVKQLDRTIIDLNSIKERKHMREDTQGHLNDIMHDLDQIMSDAIGGHLYRKHLKQLQKEWKLKILFGTKEGEENDE